MTVSSKVFPSIQPTLGFATMDLAANLGITIANPFTDLCYYIIATLDKNDLLFWPLYSKIATVNTF